MPVGSGFACGTIAVGVEKSEPRALAAALGMFEAAGALGVSPPLGPPPQAPTESTASRPKAGRGFCTTRKR